MNGLIWVTAFWWSSNTGKTLLLRGHLQIRGNALQ
jgi:hypothetical protein